VPVLCHDLIKLRIREIANKEFEYWSIVYEGLIALEPRLISLELDIYALNNKSTESYVRLFSKQIKLEELRIHAECNKLSYWKKIIDCIGKVSALKILNFTNLANSVFEKSDLIEILPNLKNLREVILDSPETDLLTLQKDSSNV